MMNFIKSEINNRLGIYVDFSEDMQLKKYLTFKILKSNFFKHQVDTYKAPSQLINDLKNLVKKYFNNLSNKQKNTKLNQLLFIPLTLFNHIYHTLDDDKERLLYVDGYQLSKELLTSVMSPHDLYLVKDILLKEEIIKTVTYDDGYSFSVEDKRAIKYALNIKYNTSECEIVENKYTTKFQLLVQNGLAMGQKKQSLKASYFPYNTAEKNLQFFYQKNMKFDQTEFKKLLISKYHDAFEIIEGKKETTPEKFKELSLIWSYYNSLNSHTFKASESHGRIYMPFQSIPKFLRSSIRIGHNEKIYELFDIHCCFVNLSAKIIKTKYSNDENIVNECNKIIKLTNEDIYQKIINWNVENLDNFNSTREKIKEFVMRWIFSNRRERAYFKEKYNEIKGIDLYFMNNFPLFYDIVTHYKMISKRIIKNRELMNKSISELSIECFKFESDLMLGKIIPALEKEYKNVPFISLHDAIFIPERFKILEYELKNKILSLMERT